MSFILEQPLAKWLATEARAPGIYSIHLQYYALAND